MSAAAASSSEQGSAYLNGSFQLHRAPEVSHGSTLVQAINAKRVRWYNSAIEKAGLEGSFGEALELLQDMIVSGLEPQDVTLLIAALACIPAGRTTQALSLLEVLQDRGFTHPKVDVYTRALITALKKSDIELALFLVEDARREVIYPHELRSIEAELQKAAAN